MDRFFINKEIWKIGFPLKPGDVIMMYIKCHQMYINEKVKATLILVGFAMFGATFNLVTHIRLP